MLPAHQRLDLDDLVSSGVSPGHDSWVPRGSDVSLEVGVQALLHLVVDHELFAFESPSQVALELEPPVDLLFHAGVEDHVAGFAPALGAVHGDVGLAQEVLGAIRL